MRKLKQFINRIKFFPRAVKQFALNVKQTAGRTGRVIFIGILEVVGIVYLMLCATVLFVVYHPRPARFNMLLTREYQRSLGALNCISKYLGGVGE